MVLFKRIEVDLEAERKRIAKCDYNKRQRKALLKLVDLFEQGKWQECLNHINNKKSFPYNESGEYSEKEHIGIEIGDILHEVAYFNVYTQAELLKQAEAALKRKVKPQKA